jgi:hypothetical protein
MLKSTRRAATASVIALPVRGHCLSSVTVRHRHGVNA